jgi:hypothetical protein
VIIFQAGVPAGARLILRSVAMRAYLVLVCAAIGSPLARAQNCPYWMGGRTPGEMDFFVYVEEGPHRGIYGVQGGPIRLTRFDGYQWTTLPLPPIPNGQILGVPILDDGAGPTMYTLSRTVTGTGGHAYYATRWNGQTWDLMPPNFLTQTTMAHSSVDIGTGPQIYGRLNWSGPIPYGVLRWNGAAWEPIATGASPNIKLMFPHAGSMYMVGNYYAVNGVYTEGVARWDGQQWYAVPGWGGSDVGYSGFARFDSGTGPAIYLTSLIDGWGQFFQPGVFRFDGQQFSTLGYAGGGATLVGNVRVFDDGRGPALYISGWFQSFAGVPARGIIRWDGQNYEPLGAGRISDFLAPVEGPFGRALFVSTIAGTTSYGLWIACPACYQNCDLSTTAPVLNVGDFTCFLQKYAAGDPYANCDNSTVSPLLSVADFTCFLQRFVVGCP